MAAVSPTGAGGSQEKMKQEDLWYVKVKSPLFGRDVAAVKKTTTNHQMTAFEKASIAVGRASYDFFKTLDDAKLFAGAFEKTEDVRPERDWDIIIRHYVNKKEYDTALKYCEKGINSTQYKTSIKPALQNWKERINELKKESSTNKLKKS